VEEQFVQAISNFTHCHWTPCKVLPNMGFVLRSTQIM